MGRVAQTKEQKHKSGGLKSKKKELKEQAKEAKRAKNMEMKIKRKKLLKGIDAKKPKNKDLPGKKRKRSGEAEEDVAATRKKRRLRPGKGQAPYKIPSFAGYDIMLHA